MPYNLIYLGLYFVVSKLYANTLMAVLNARRSGVEACEAGCFDLAKQVRRRETGLVQLSELRAAPRLSKVPDHPSFTIEISQHV